jgi:general secretion pathway protein K
MRTKSRQKGVALILVLVSLALLSVLSVELLVASRVDIRIGRNARDRMQAEALARSGARFGLLRLMLYREVKNKVSEQKNLPIAPTLVEGIWSAPLPPLPLPGMEKVIWPGSMITSISSEGSKIPINLLDGNESRGSNIETQQSVREQLKKLIEGMLQDEDFDKTYRGLKPEELIDPIQDWVDSDSDRLQGGDENGPYDRGDRPYRARNDRMSSLTELHMLENWNDDLVRRIAPHLSVLNTRLEINPNYVSGERLKSFAPALSLDDLRRIEVRRMEQPFDSLDSLAEFIRTDPEIRGGRDFAFPSTFKGTLRETVFLVEGRGIVGDVRRTLRLGLRLTEEKPKAASSGSPAPTPGAAASGSSATPAASPEKPGKLLDIKVVTVEESI